MRKALFAPLQAAYYGREDRGWAGVCVRGVVGREEEG